MSLECDAFIKTTAVTSKKAKLTAEGETYVEKGSPEFQVHAAVPADGISLTDINVRFNIDDHSFPFEQKNLQAKLGAAVVKIGMSQCMRLKWLRMDKAAGKLYAEVF